MIMPAKKEIDARDVINQKLKIGDTVVFMPQGNSKGNLMYGKITRFTGKSAAIEYIKFYSDNPVTSSQTISLGRIAKIDDEAYVEFMLMSGGRGKYQ